VPPFGPSLRLRPAMPSSRTAARSRMGIPELALGLAAMNLGTTGPSIPADPTLVAMPAVVDTLGRPLHDLRISVTDRCNFRCTYCMPEEVFGREYQFLDRREILSFEEITRLTRIFVARDVEKVRLTGGEPTLRRGLPKLVSMLREI